MKRFLRKQLPAVLLVLAMMVSLMPAAMAADCGHNNWSSWQKLDNTQYQRKCQSNDCNGTQEANHTWSTTYSTDGSYHWKNA